MSDDTVWVEPDDEKTTVGYRKFSYPQSPYDLFMEEQEIPIYRNIGVRSVQDLPLQPWKRMGGKGTFIQLFGTEHLWGSYLVEVPGAGALNAERHLYEELFLVVEGRGTTEVWTEGGKDKQVFEWQKGSLFTVPLNAFHRIVNAASRPALLLAGTTAPNAINLYSNVDFIFNCSYHFSDRYNPEDRQFFKPNENIERDPIRGLAMRKTNIIPDVFTCELPLDNRRSPGYRRIEPRMAGNNFYLWIGQHEPGRYTKAHAHKSAAVLLCLNGKGYTYTWPASLGMTPWKDGKTDQIKRQDYESVGMVTAAPMSGDWYHAHFGVSKDPLRLMAWFGPNHPARDRGHRGELNKDYANIDIQEGGTQIRYCDEDPFLRREFEESLAKEGIASQMEPSLYE